MIKSIPQALIKSYKSKSCCSRSLSGIVTKAYESFNLQHRQLSCVITGLSTHRYLSFHLDVGRFYTFPRGISNGRRQTLRLPLRALLMTNCRYGTFTFRGGNEKIWLEYQTNALVWLWSRLNGGTPTSPNLGLSHSTRLDEGTA